MKWKKKNNVISPLLIIVLILGLFGSQVLADEKAEITKVERVEWAGVQLFGIRILGEWRPVRPGYTFWGAYYTSASAYFRLNEDDQTIFRGLGRESNFAQTLFPTLSPRENIENLFKPVDKAWESLQKFDEQRSTGEAIYMTGSFLESAGEITVWTALITSLAYLFQGYESRAIFYRNVAVVGTVAYVLGIMGKFYGGILTQEALGHLDDAVHYFNEADGKMASRNSSIFLTVKIENNTLMPVIGFNF